MRPVVVLHGAWHQPAHFTRVVERLRDRGVEVAVPDLAGHSLTENTSVVQELVDRFDQEPVVLAHSFGGVTATGLERVAHLLFLNSFVFDAGETAQQWGERVEREMGRPAAGLALVVGDDGMIRVDPAGAREGLFADCDEKVAARATALLRAEPMTIYTEAPARAAWKQVPSTYVAGEHDRAIDPVMVARFAARCGTTLTWPTSHSSYLSRPEDTAALVLEHV